MDLQQSVQGQQIELLAVASRLKYIEIIGRYEGKHFLLRLYHDKIMETVV
jgi:hypothetical protein